MRIEQTRWTRANGRADADRGMLERSLELSSQELLEANSEMRALFERLIYSSMDGIFAFDREYRYTVWKPALERILGLSKLQTLGKSAFEVFPYLTETGGDQFYRDALADKTVVARERLYILPDTGERILIEGHFPPLLDESGKVSGGLAVLRDITERKRAEEALRESEQRFRDYAETASDWLWETGPDHRFTRFAEPLATLGVEPTRWVGAMPWDVATDVEEEPEKWRLQVATLAARQPFRDFRYRTARADGSALYLRVSGKPVSDGEGRFLGYRGVASDVTTAVRADQAEKALHQAQAELAHVTRVTTLGELAASIAHEINQPLAAIVADADACLHWLQPGRPHLDNVREALAAIVKDGNRAAEVITRIRALLSRSSVGHRPCDLAGVIRAVLPLVGPELGRHGIVLQTSLTTDLPQVMGDRIQLQQVLLNLLVNAAEAMREVPPERRRLVVRSTVEQLEDGPCTVVAVEDTGIGFREPDAAHLFDAFFTTKPDGLGMGLSISRSIIDGHGGRLWATANADHGATFHFALPAMR